MLRHFRRDSGSGCCTVKNCRGPPEPPLPRYCAVLPGPPSAAPSPAPCGTAGVRLSLSRPSPATAVPPQPPPPRYGGAGVRLSPPPPRARRAPRHSSSNGQSTRDGSGLGPHILQRYLIYPAGHRAALTPQESLEQGAGPVGQSAPAAQGHRVQSRWGSPWPPLDQPHLLLHPPRGGQVLCDQAAPKEPQHLPAPSSVRDGVCTRCRAETVRNNHKGAQLHIPQARRPHGQASAPIPKQSLAAGLGSLAREQQGVGRARCCPTCSLQLLCRGSIRQHTANIMTP